MEQIRKKGRRLLNIVSPSFIKRGLGVSFLIISLLTGCRNMTEAYVYSGKIQGTAILIGVVNGDYSGIRVNLDSVVVTGSLTTNVTGAFAFTDLPDGTYNIECLKSGFTTGNATNINIVNSSSWSGSVTLTPGVPPEPPE